MTGREPVRAMVTGASSGIGREYARALAARGCPLVLVARRVDRLEALAAELRDRRGIEVEVLPADLTEPDQLTRVEMRLAMGSPVGLLVNNAGFGTRAPFHEVDIEREDRQIRLNVTAVVRLTRAALPGMVARREGAIINVSSVLGLMPAPYMSVYGATKAFEVRFTEALHEELRGTGVRVQVFCPGLTRTEFTAEAGMEVAERGVLWMDPADVVARSLEDLNRGVLVSVPGQRNRFLSLAIRITPGGPRRRLMGLLHRLRH